MATDDVTRPYYAGDGRVGVLFVHGFTGNPHSLRHWAETTAGAGYRVSLPLLPGHATSWQDLATTRWEDWFAEAERAFLQLDAVCDKTFVAGLSMGGALSLLLAERYPDKVSGLIQVNPALHAADRRAGLAGVARRFVTTTPGVASDIADPTKTEEGGYDLVPIAAVDELNQLFKTTRAGLARVVCPALYFRSVTDHVVPPASMRLILDKTSSVERTEVLLQRSFHVATLDYDAPRIESRTLEFLAAHRG